MSRALTRIWERAARRPRSAARQNIPTAGSARPQLSRMAQSLRAERATSYPPRSRLEDDLKGYSTGHHGVRIRSTRAPPASRWACGDTEDAADRRIIRFCGRGPARTAPSERGQITAPRIPDRIRDLHGEHNVAFELAASASLSASREPHVSSRRNGDSRVGDATCGSHAISAMSSAVHLGLQTASLSIWHAADPRRSRRCAADARPLRAPRCSRREPAAAGSR